MKGIEKPNTFLRKKAGLSPSISHRLLKKNVRSLPLDVVEKICLKLHCTPNDLIQWIPDNKVEEQMSHPLQNLRTSPVPNLRERLQKLSKAQALELNKKIDEMEGLE
ncbi:MAG: helix-turn-helix transcriptional regulator [Chitinophagales bacterium]|nr:helix-turn-helix transcriptional regulator [Bacteroidota bacterium]MBP7262377.1 helix-turn-helix transcriptional regulator [Bacteroidia bacterium]MBP9188063.1 helix-turn-helix transcriptional regulator [Chitinophagales bacterium]MBK8486917.1 helix-turn-helix transcriptional regulator [Bacteroidota bacterium]MBK8681186.1 helix-turn-helix transcriptional regulator [Bacteroidota bacterium]